MRRPDPTTPAAPPMTAPWPQHRGWSNRWRRLRGRRGIAVGLVVVMVVVTATTWRLHDSSGGGTVGVGANETPDVAYVYDPQGRLKAASDRDGESAVYSYDATGNLLGVERHPSEQLSVIQFTPTRAAPGDEVTVEGTGFAEDFDDNSVRIGDAQAEVVGGNGFELTVRVPEDARTGSVTVSRSGGEAEGPGELQVEDGALPVVESVSVTAVEPGAEVTITGTGFDPNPLLDHVAVGETYAEVQSASETELVVTAPSVPAAGPVSVSTPTGTAQSDDEVVVLPPDVGPDDLGPADLAEVVPLDGDEPSGASVVEDGIVLFTFSGERGHRVSLAVQSYREEGEPGEPCPSIGLVVFAPDGATLFDSGHGNLGSISRICDPAGTGLSLPATGTYLVATMPDGATGDGERLELAVQPFDPSQADEDTADTGEADDQDDEDEDEDEDDREVTEPDSRDELDMEQILADLNLTPEDVEGLDLATMAGGEPAAPTAATGEVSDGTERFPVDLTTGRLQVSETDLVIPDVVPLELARTHAPMASETGAGVFAFGLGAPLEHDMVFETGSNNQLAHLTLPTGQEVTFMRTSDGVDEWDAVFEQTTVSTVYGARVTWAGGSWEMTLGDGTTMGFEPVEGRLIWSTDTQGNVTTVTLEDDPNDANDRRVAGLVSSSGRTITFGYDDEGRIIEARDHLGNTVTYTYAVHQGSTRVGRSTQHYDESLVRVAHSDGWTIDYSYDEAGRIRSAVSSTGGDGGTITQTSFDYDADGRVAAQTVDGSTWRFAYTTDAEGMITRTEVTDPAGLVRRVDFQENRWVRDTSAVGTPAEWTTTAERDPESQLVTTVVDGDGNRTTYGYDDQAYVTETVTGADAPGEQRVAYGYDDQGNLTAEQGPGGETTYEYDPQGRMTGSADPTGFGAAYGYDPAGYLSEIAGSDGSAASVRHELGHRTTLLDTTGAAVAEEYYDAAGRLAATVDAAGNTVRHSYSEDGLEVTNESTDGTTTTAVHDPAGNLRSLTDANGSTLRYDYDERGRLVARTDAQGRRDEYAYDAVDRLAAHRDRRGNLAQYGYDAAGRLATETYTPAGGGAPETVSYAYDAAGRPTRIDDSVYGTIGFTYDERGRLVGEATEQGEVGYRYDDQGHRAAMTLPDGTEVSYGYDELGRMASIAVDDTAAVAATWNDRGQLAEVQMPNDVTATYGYGDDGQLAAVDYGDGVGALRYGYDDQGRRTGTAGDLATLATATHDAARASGDDDRESGAEADVRVGAGNQLTAVGDAELRYDEAGNLTSDGTTTYTWDIRGRLVAVDGDVEARFAYDPLGRRVASTVDGTTTQNIYDGDQLVQQQIGDAPPTTYLTGPDLDEVFARVAGDEVTTYVTDVQGTVLGLVDATGELATTYRYDAFGNVTVEGADDPNPFTYTGRELDPTGLYYYRARYYDPALGRFLSEDPAELAAGDPNLYAYVGGDPINRTDPSGMFTECVAVAVAMGSEAWWLLDLSLDILQQQAYGEISELEGSVKQDIIQYVLESNWNLFIQTCLGTALLPPVFRGARAGVGSFGRGAGTTTGRGAGGVDPGGLIHFTNRGSASAIARSGELRGGTGIWALPSSARYLTPAQRARRATSSADRMEVGVPIPDAAVSQFRRPVPIGPASGYQRWAGVYRAPAGTIRMDTGQFLPQGGWLANARGQFFPYGVDAGFYALLGVGTFYVLSDE